MLRYWQQLVSVAYRHCARGVAFNVMSPVVDWRRDDLFHLPFDTMARFVGGALSRHFVVRHDYGARESRRLRLPRGDEPVRACRPFGQRRGARGGLVHDWTGAARGRWLPAPGLRRVARGDRARPRAAALRGLDPRASDSRLRSRDGMGCYPLFSCRDWERLPEDLRRARGAAGVAHPRHGSVRRLHRRGPAAFIRCARPYKAHFVTDLARRPTSRRTRRHTRNTDARASSCRSNAWRSPGGWPRRGSRCTGSSSSDTRITGPPPSRRSRCGRQLAVPGVRMFKADRRRRRRRPAPLVRAGRGGLRTPRGDERARARADGLLRALRHAVEQLREEVRWLALGSSAGAPDARAGLASGDSRPDGPPGHARRTCAAASLSPTPTSDCRRTGAGPPLTTFPRTGAES